MSNPSGISALISGGLPLAILWGSLARSFVKMAQRKGTNVKVAMIGAFPVWAIFFGIWLISQPNKTNPTVEDDVEQSDDTT